MRVYLDHASATPLRPEAWAAERAAQEVFASPLSVHWAGREARTHLENARFKLAGAFGLPPRSLIFTSGASEANSLAILGTLLAFAGGHLLTTQSEHSSVLGAARAWERLGYPVTYLAPDSLGRIEPQAIAAALRPDTRLVSIGWANSETGNIAPMAEISALVHSHGAYLHSDAALAWGIVQPELVDLLSLSSPKLGGPKASGLLYHKSEVNIFPLIYGAGEQGERGGSENLAGIAGFAAAALAARSSWDREARSMAALRERLEAGLLGVEGTEINGDLANRLPQISNVTVNGVDGEALALNLDLLGVAVSAGSACSSGNLEPSHVLLAMGKSGQEARASLRFSLGALTTEAEINLALAAFSQAVQNSRLD